MPALALFGITNSGLDLFVNLVILFLVVVWIALIAWTYLDARRRIADGVLVACATGASLFPYVGTIVYTILRPPEFLEDARERELEIRAAELRVRTARGAVLPELRAPDRAHVPALPELPRARQGSVRVVREADRPALDAVPVLRDARPRLGAPGGARRAPLRSGLQGGHAARGHARTRARALDQPPGRAAEPAGRAQQRP